MGEQISALWEAPEAVNLDAKLKSLVLLQSLWFFFPLKVTQPCPTEMQLTLKSLTHTLLARLRSLKLYGPVY